MVVYSVRWTLDHELSKGKGRKNYKEASYYFSVLCRSSKDAVACLEYLFVHDFCDKYSSNLTIEDGSVSLTRVKVDSRNFNPTYLYCDGIRQPISLSNVKSSLDKLLLLYRPY